jgi:hypothetical protein
VNPIVDHVPFLQQQQQQKATQSGDVKDVKQSTVPNTNANTNTYNNETMNSIAREPEKAKVKVCPFFKQGFCKKGDECNMSHRLEQDSNDANGNQRTNNNNNRKRQAPNREAPSNPPSATPPSWKERVMMGNGERQAKEKERAVAVDVGKRNTKQKEKRLEAACRANPNVDFESVSFPFGLSACNISIEKLLAVNANGDESERNKTTNPSNTSDVAVNFLTKNIDLLREIFTHLKTRDRVTLRTCCKTFIAQCWKWRPRECPAQIVEAETSACNDGGYAFWKLALTLDVKREIVKDDLSLVYFVLGIAHFI